MTTSALPRIVAAPRLGNGSAPSGPSHPREGLPDPAAFAAEAGLRYVSDTEPGIERLRHGRGFTYRYPDGETVRDAAVRKRARALAIPPAWTEVWICLDPQGHIQATGRDAQGRKQYRYHPRWTEARNQTKFFRMVEFGRSLPAIRRRVREDLSQPANSRAKVLATVVALLEVTCIRIGNEDYRRQNGSYGLTTLRRRHVEMEGRQIVFRFKAKGGQEREIVLEDPELTRIVMECQDLPGQELFQYVDEERKRRCIGSTEVNAYLREAGSSSFTAKDFRTWMGSVHALRALRRLGPAESEREAAAKLLAAIDEVAEHLRNTRAVCREFYIHPLLQDGYRHGWLGPALEAVAPEPVEGLHEDERILLALVEAGNLLWAQEASQAPPR